MMTVYVIMNIHTEPNYSIETGIPLRTQVIYENDQLTLELIINVRFLYFFMSLRNFLL